MTRKTLLSVCLCRELYDSNGFQLADHLLMNFSVHIRSRHLIIEGFIMFMNDTQLDCSNLSGKEIILTICNVEFEW